MSKIPTGFQTWTMTALWRIDLTERPGALGLLKADGAAWCDTENDVAQIAPTPRPRGTRGVTSRFVSSSGLRRSRANPKRRMSARGGRDVTRFEVTDLFEEA